MERAVAETLPFETTTNCLMLFDAFETPLVSRDGSSVVPPRDMTRRPLQSRDVSHWSLALATRPAQFKSAKCSSDTRRSANDTRRVV